MSYDTYIFDLDGTLTDPKEGITKSYQYAAAAFGMPTELEDLTRFIGPGIRDSFRELGIHESELENAVAKYREYFTTTGILQNALYPDLPGVLARLKAADKNLVVATNKVTAYAKQILEHFAIAEYFSFVSGDELDGSLSVNGKGNIIRIALESLPAAGNSVMLGDRKHDILGANAVGIDSIGVLWGYGSRAELEGAGATYIIERAEEIFSI